MSNLGTRNEEDLEILKKLLVHLNPMIHLAGNADSTFEMLLYLSEMDPTFHKIELVKSVRKQLRDNMLSHVEKSVDEYLEEHRTKIRIDNPAESLVKEVSSNPAFCQMRNNLKAKLNEACSSIMNGDETQYFEDLLDDHTILANMSPMHSTETSLNSSLNQSGFLFVHPGQYNIICDNLRNKKDVDVVNEALSMLLVVTPGEPVSQECWPTMQKTLVSLLQVDDDEIFLKALKFHIRLLASQSHNAVKDGFLNILHAVTGFWLSKNLSRHLPHRKIPFHIQESKLLALIKTMLQFFKEFPMVWVRFPAKYASQIIEEVLNSFSCCMNVSANHLSLFDVVALLDPKCKWFSSWMHGQWGRKRCVEALQSKRLVLAHALDTCIFLLNSNVLSPLDSIQQNILSENVMFQLIFSHHINLLVILMKYSDGRTLYPIQCHRSPNHFSIKKFILVLFDSCLKCNKYTTKLIFKTLMQLVRGNEFLCKLVCDSNALFSMVESLPEKFLWYQWAVFNYLEAVNSYFSGHNYLLTGKSQGDKKLHELLSQFSKTLTIEPNRTITLITILYCNMLSSPLGVFVLSEDDFLTRIRTFMEQQDIVNIMSYEFVQSYMQYTLHSHSEIWELSHRNILEKILNAILLEYAKSNRIDIILLNNVCISQVGCKVLKDILIISPFWDIVKLSDDKDIQISLTRPSTNEKTDSMLPLICLPTTASGIDILLSNEAIQHDIYKYLENNVTDDLYLKILDILIMISSSLHGSIVLSQLNFKLKLIGRLENLTVDGNTIIVDEETSKIYSIILRLEAPKDTIVKSVEGLEQFNLGVLLEQDLHEEIQSMPPVKSLLGKFISESIDARKTTTWSNEARKAVRTDLSSGSLLEETYFLALVESCLDSFQNSREEQMEALFENVRLNLVPALTPLKELQNDTCDSNGRLLQCEDLTPSNVASTTKTAIDIMLRYGEGKNLISTKPCHRSQMLQLVATLESSVYGSPAELDWFSFLWYLKSECNTQRLLNILKELSLTRIGFIIWPCLQMSHFQSMGLDTNTMIYGGIVQAVRLVLYKESPTVYLGLDNIGGQVVWNIIGEWITQCFIGVISPEQIFNVHSLTLLYGADYFIYSVAAMCVCLHKRTLQNVSESSYEKIVRWQTEPLDFKINDYIALIDQYARRCRHNVLTILNKQINRLKH